MMDDKVQFKRKIIEVGGSLSTVIPKELLQYLNLDKDDEIILIADIGKHGRFVSFWKKNDNKN